MFIILMLAAVGAAAGAHLVPDRPNSLVAAVIGAVLLGGVGAIFKRHAVALLGGLIGTGIFVQVLAPSGLDGWLLFIAALLVFIALAAVSISNERGVVILITSFEGAVLLLSGLIPIIASWPGLFRFLESTNRASWIFLPFVILVPTAIGCLLQISDAKNHGSGVMQT